MVLLAASIDMPRRSPQRPYQSQKTKATHNEELLNALHGLCTDIRRDEKGQQSDHHQANLRTRQPTAPKHTK